MTHDTDQTDDPQLEALFEAARAKPPKVSETLMAQVLADAHAAQPTQRRGLWAAFMQATGGVPALCGLATAACVGVWIGIAPPEVLPDLGGIVLGFETTTETAPEGFGWDIEEG